MPICQLVNSVTISEASIYQKLLIEGQVSTFNKPHRVIKWIKNRSPALISRNRVSLKVKKAPPLKEIVKPCVNIISEMMTHYTLLKRGIRMPKI
jgi:hypothetical protein